MLQGGDVRLEEVWGRGQHADCRLWVGGDRWAAATAAPAPPAALTLPAAPAATAVCGGRGAAVGGPPSQGWGEVGQGPGWSARRGCLHGGHDEGVGGLGLVVGGVRRGKKDDFLLVGSWRICRSVVGSAAVLVDAQRACATGCLDLGEERATRVQVTQVGEGLLRALQVTLHRVVPAAQDDGWQDGEQAGHTHDDHNCLGTQSFACLGTTTLVLAIIAVMNTIAFIDLGVTFTEPVTAKGPVSWTRLFRTELKQPVHAFTRPTLLLVGMLAL